MEKMELIIYQNVLNGYQEPCPMTHEPERGTVFPL